MGILSTLFPERCPHGDELKFCFKCRSGEVPEVNSTKQAKKDVKRDAKGK